MSTPLAELPIEKGHVAGFYVNVQVGESLVTNPDPSATPDELLISAIGEHARLGLEPTLAGCDAKAPGAKQCLQAWL